MSPVKYPLLAFLLLASVSFSATNITGCTDIASGGDYVLTNSLAGANVSVPEIYGLAVACVKISSSNVTLDCDGFSITNNGTSFAMGIGIIPATNVTVRNCAGLSGYYEDLHAKGVNDSLFVNITAFNSSNDNLLFEASSRNNITDIVSFDSNNAAYGIELNGGSNNNFLTRVTVFGNAQSGVAFISSSSNNVITNSTAFDNGQHGFFSYFNSNNNTFRELTAFSNTGSDGIRVELSSANATVINNVLFSNAYGGLGVLSSSGVLVANNTAFTNAVVGFNIGASNNTVANNSAFSNGYAGFFYNFGSGSVFINDTSFGNNVSGFFVDGGTDAIFTNTTTFGNANYGYFIRSTNILLNSSNVSGNTYSGIELQNASNVTIQDSLAQENGQFDLSVTPYVPEDCDNLVLNLTGSGGRPINYTNETVAWAGITPSELVLCDADGSSISSAIVQGSDTLFNNGVLVAETNGSVINNTNSSNNYVGFLFVDGSGNTLANSVGSNNAFAGFQEFTTTTPAATVVNSVFAGNGWAIVQDSSNSV
ncbi:MAG: right-handed parallel beta-helix repeat-containing protein, partial [Candidatus Micrarchaeota archaeon]